MRIGQGMDAHRFAENAADRPLRLCGVEIPDAPGLEGHSDADVALHAVADAILGAAALGDLGALFGTDDERYAGADSAVFLHDAVHRATQFGLDVANVDCTLVAQRPRLAPHLPAMRERLAELLGADPSVVSVKATTTDGLGFTGRGEGIACLAVVLLGPIDPAHATGR